MSTSFDFTVTGLENLEAQLYAAQRIRLQGIIVKNTTQMFIRARTSKNPAVGGTPFDTGELRKSVRANPNAGEVGYLKDYAPHVEFGHRTKNGGYVEGQHFLRNNVEIQKEEYKKDLIKALEGAKK